MPLSTSAREDNKTAAQFDRCCEAILSNLRGVKTYELHDYCIEKATQSHAVLETFNAEYIIADWLSYHIKETITDKGQKVELTIGNLYSLMILCGETPPPWQWVDQKQFKGQLGVYQEHETCCVLKRRISSIKRIAKVNKHIEDE